MRFYKPTRLASFPPRKPQSPRQSLPPPPRKLPQRPTDSTCEPANLRRSSNNRKSAGTCFIGKPLKTYGWLVFLPDPEPDQAELKRTTKGKGKTTARGGCRGKHTRLFIGSLQPLLVAGRRRRQSASLSDPNADHDGDVDVDVDVVGDTDNRVWPGEYAVLPVVVTGLDAELKWQGRGSLRGRQCVLSGLHSPWCHCGLAVVVDIIRVRKK